MWPFGHAGLGRAAAGGAAQKRPHLRPSTPAKHDGMGLMIKKIAFGALAFAALAQPSSALESKKAGVDTVEVKKAEVKKADVNKAGVKKGDVKNGDAKKVEAAKPERRKAEAKEPAGKKVESKVEGRKEGEPLHALIAQHAKAHGIPEDLVHRVVKRESRYNPRAIGRGGTMGLMQIKHGTARALGYAGTAAGLLSPETNLTYGVKYLAGAYKVAGGDHNRAIAFFARGYYYDAKRKGMLASLAGSKAKGKPEPVEEVVEAAVEKAASSASLFAAAGSPYDGDPR
jgi:soluble lytic murein transglycosylase-like protein